MRKSIFISLLIFIAGSTLAQDRSLFEKQYFISGNDTLRLRILTPVDYSPKRKYPVVLFLHGAGERGNDNEAQLTWGADLFLDSLNRARYPAIVIFPQCPTDSTWSDLKFSGTKDSLGGLAIRTDKPANTTQRLVTDFLDTLIVHGGVDRSRVYIGGLSMGGFGTFELLWRRPDLFAAAIPICGGGDPSTVTMYRKKMPVWIFHGDADPVVPILYSRRMLAALKASGAKATMTEYPGVGHDSWKNAFAEPELLHWLFAQKK
jgi:predicted peptidase